MVKQIQILFIVTVSLLTFVSIPAFAQSEGNFTGDNRVFLTLDGITRPYTFTSDQLLVRYNKTTQKVECILDIATLYPTEVGTPPTMAYDVLFGAKYPELTLLIDAPVEKLNAKNLYSEILEKKSTISFQGVSNQTTVPVAFTPDKNSFIFSTNFDLMLDDFEASVPIKYMPFLTGRMVITVRNAKWVNLKTR
jgi:hypothetical protein